MTFLQHSNNPAVRQQLAVPPACPKCQAADACSAAKRPTLDSYWRCLRCGEVWNPSLIVGFSQRRWNR
jgi:hypothetical protein